VEGVRQPLLPERGPLAEAPAAAVPLMIEQEVVVLPPSEAEEEAEEPGAWLPRPRMHAAAVRGGVPCR
jgi:hypothetical protein